jgi:hypothetical protein
MHDIFARVKKTVTKYWSRTTKILETYTKLPISIFIVIYQYILKVFNEPACYSCRHIRLWSSVLKIHGGEWTTNGFVITLSPGKTVNKSEIITLITNNRP